MTLIPFTNKGFENLKQKLIELNLKRPEAVKALQRGREMGDLSENGLYKAAKFELSDLDRQIRFNKNLIKYAKVYSPTDNKITQIGHFITVKSNVQTKKYQITGEYEANPKEFKISYKSPIGEKLLGKKLNDVVIIQTPNGTIEYIITDISLK